MHMLDLFTASITVCKRIRDCGRVKYGVHGDHDAVELKFYLNTIAFKNKLAKRIPGYKAIREENRGIKTSIISYMIMEDIQNTQNLWTLSM